MPNSLQTQGLSMEFSRQEHWSGLPFLSPEDLPDSGIKSRPPAMQEDSLPSELPGKPINKCINSFSGDSKYYESKGNRERRRENEDGACDIIQHSQRKAKVKVAQSCPTLCDPMDYTAHEILQARTLEWVAFPFSRGSSWPRHRTGVSCIAGRFFTNWATREVMPSKFLQKNTNNLRIASHCLSTYSALLFFTALTTTWNSIIYINL